MAVSENIRILLSQLPPSVRLIAVSKTMPVYDILEAYNAGQRIFGENRVQEILNKKDQLPSDIEWHLIGHLQTNKVRSVIPYVRMIHSVDTEKLIRLIDSESARIMRKTDCLLQIHIASEETKSGFLFNDLSELLSSSDILKLKNVNILGVMGMATFTSDQDQIREEFRRLAEYFRTLKSKYFNAHPYFSEISMGMSGDYKIAIEEGSTLIRIGSLIFGERN
jgi:PLP dependent protein